MTYFSKKLTLVFIGMLSLSILLFGATFYYFLFTKKGGTFLFDRLIKVVNDTDKEIVWQKNDGTLMSGITYKDVVLEDLKWFPTPNKLKIQTLIIDINSFGLDGITLQVENARFSLPDSDPILFYGKIEKQILDFNIYSKGISDSEIKSLFKVDFLNKVTGSLSEIDLFVKGIINEPSFSGEFLIQRITREGFSLEQAPCVIEISFKNTNDALGIYGPITLKSGIIRGKKTALVRLQESKLMFNGDPGKPNFDINATSVIERVKMIIALKGSFKEPDLKINSDPPMPKERLLLALATNKTWKKTEEVFSSGRITPDIARDFIDYFIFGGQSNKFAEKFGLKSLSVKYDTNTKGVVVSKDLSHKLEGRYEIEEKRNTEGKSDVSQKVGGEFKVTETISLEAKKELKQKERDSQEEKKPSDDQLFLKFKKTF